MQQCLYENCDVEFEERDGKKFCSTSCRVMYNRKHGKKNTITPVQMQVMYNSILEAINKISTVNNHPPSFGVIMPNKPTPDYSVKPIIKRSFDYYKQARVDCENIEQWEDLKAEILNSDLSMKQKTLLTS